MRPDPYKIARSRSYLAKQRAKYGDSKEPKETDKIPRWLRNLPSNADRYQDLEDIDDDKDFDISNLADLESLLNDIKIDAAKSDNNDEYTSESGSCELYEKLTRIGIPRLEGICQDYQLVDEDLPVWFRKAVISNTTKKETTSDIDRIASQVKLVKPKLVIPAFSQGQEKEECEKVDHLSTKKKTKDEEFLDQLLE